MLYYIIYIFLSVCFFLFLKSFALKLLNLFLDKFPYFKKFKIFLTHVYTIYGIITRITLFIRFIVFQLPLFSDLKFFLNFLEIYITPLEFKSLTWEAKRDVSLEELKRLKNLKGFLPHERLELDILIEEAESRKFYLSVFIGVAVVGAFFLYVIYNYQIYNPGSDGFNFSSDSPDSSVDSVNGSATEQFPDVTNTDNSSFSYRSFDPTDDANSTSGDPGEPRPTYFRFRADRPTYLDDSEPTVFKEIPVDSNDNTSMNTEVRHYILEDVDPKDLPEDFQ